MRIKRLLEDESGQVLKYIWKIGIPVAVLILLVVEVGPLIWLRFSMIQDAEDLAAAAAFQYRVYQNEKLAIDEVVMKMQTMGYSDEEINSSILVFLPPGNAKKEKVQFTAVKYANTLVTRHIGPLKKFAKVSVTKEAPIVAPGEKP